jgi:arginyl-tRNA synthetase
MSVRSLISIVSGQFSRHVTESMTQLSLQRVLSKLPESRHVIQPVTKSRAPAGAVYQSSVALQLYPHSRDDFKNPRDLATQLSTSYIHKSNGTSSGNNDVSFATSQVEVTGPGFINFGLESQFVWDRIASFARHNEIPSLHNNTDQQRRVVIDMSSPNIAKEMHVGHLRSTIIGDSIARTLEFCGHDVSRVNHIGDWGTQFGMLITHLKETYPDFLHQPPVIGDLQQFYKQAKQRFDEDEDFKLHARTEVVALQSGHPESRRAWELICEISRQEFQKLYDRLNIHIEERGESFYNDMLPGIVKQAQKAGASEPHDGAEVIFLPEYEHPLFLRKRDGGFTYDTTDLAALQHRVKQDHRDWLIYVVDAGQGVHFDMVFKGAIKAGILEADTKVRLDHVEFGVMLGEDGKKFKSRSGDTVRLVDLLDEAKRRAHLVLSDRQQDKDTGFESASWTDEQLAHLSEAIGYGAVKYADLRRRRHSDYSFSYDQMLDMKGNTAVYLLYAYARIASILRKAEASTDTLQQLASDYSNDELAHSTEYHLAVTCARFHDIVETVQDDLCPHHLCDYAYELCESLNAFYRDCRVIGDDRQDQRLILLQSTSLVLKQTLALLGIPVVDKM